MCNPRWPLIHLSYSFSRKVLTTQKVLWKLVGEAGEVAGSVTMIEGYQGMGEGCWAPSNVGENSVAQRPSLHSLPMPIGNSCR